MCPIEKFPIFVWLLMTQVTRMLSRNFSFAERQIGFRGVTIPAMDPTPESNLCSHFGIPIPIPALLGVSPDPTKNGM